MIDEALSAMEENADDAEDVWCRVGYYLFPETAPDEPLTDQDWSADQGVLFQSGSEQAIGK